jgi:hypothetical protein
MNAAMHFMKKTSNVQLPTSNDAEFEVERCALRVEYGAFSGSTNNVLTINSYG